MKKIFLLIFLCIFTLGFSQKKKKTKSKAIVEKETAIIYTESEAETTSEARVIAGFLKQNPGHAKTDHFKRKLVAMIMADNSPEAKPTIRGVSEDKIRQMVLESNSLNNSKTIAAATNAGAAKTERTVNYASVGTSSKKSAGPSEEHKRTAAMLTHLFNDDPMDKEAYINIKNRSKCNLIVKISGKKYYNLDVPAKGQNFVLVEKGEYVLTTMVCDAKYSSLKKINKDIELELNLSE
ncbi:hypothetical protein SAMN05443633_11360 [Chryseobacterium arachidis]|uniref:DUF6759 domain-containing protein n=1 Tax=Chryseobacterium arachidis TaxID=1416778 RepID=A0A1M5IT80_9FLAO|nr:DUF6759 domain-containing protein [Chryseobacterium arachidis]SHG31471.1 hypothetical protein SAMN05443633_11360 [Chryseobacterium arachidis]